MSSPHVGVAPAGGYEAFRLRRRTFVREHRRPREQSEAARSPRASNLVLRTLLTGYLPLWATEGGNLVATTGSDRLLPDVITMGRRRALLTSQCYLRVDYLRRFLHDHGVAGGSNEAKMFRLLSHRHQFYWFWSLWSRGEILSCILRIAAVLRCLRVRPVRPRFGLIAQ